ncbi:MAG: hypothetical protein GY795_24550 [Desulfobacterales bacterium]|nr:hypothetical protein [Desulfobacterales bacterium]
MTTPARVTLDLTRNDAALLRDVLLDGRDAVTGLRSHDVARCLAMERVDSYISERLSVSQAAAEEPPAVELVALAPTQTDERGHPIRKLRCPKCASTEIGYSESVPRTWRPYAVTVTVSESGAAFVLIDAASDDVGWEAGDDDPGFQCQACWTPLTLPDSLDVEWT